MRLAHLAALGKALRSSFCSASSPVAATRRPCPQHGGYSVEFEKSGLSVPDPVAQRQDVGQRHCSPLSSTDPNGVVTDGMGNASITCTVSGSGTFAVDAEATQNGNVLHVLIDAISTKNTTSNPCEGQRHLRLARDVRHLLREPEQQAVHLLARGRHERDGRRRQGLGVLLVRRGRQRDERLRALQRARSSSTTARPSLRRCSSLPVAVLDGPRSEGPHRPRGFDDPATGPRSVVDCSGAAGSALGGGRLCLSLG